MVNLTAGDSVVVADLSVPVGLNVRAFTVRVMEVSAPHLGEFIAGNLRDRMTFAYMAHFLIGAVANDRELNQPAAWESKISKIPRVRKAVGQEVRIKKMHELDPTLSGEMSPAGIQAGEIRVTVVLEKAG